MSYLYLLHPHLPHPLAPPLPLLDALLRVSIQSTPTFSVEGNRLNSILLKRLRSSCKNLGMLEALMSRHTICSCRCGVVWCGVCVCVWVFMCVGVYVCVHTCRCAFECMYIIMYVCELGPERMGNPPIRMFGN